MNDPSVDLIAEMEFSGKLARKQIDKTSMTPIEYRLRIVDSFAARWLVENKIEKPTKSLLVTSMANELAEVAFDEADEAVDGLLGQIIH